MDGVKGANRVQERALLGYYQETKLPEKSIPTRCERFKIYFTRGIRTSLDESNWQA